MLVSIGAPRIAVLAQEARLTRAIALEADALMTALLNAETGQRGYLVTGEEAYLGPYRDADAPLSAALAELASIRAGRPQVDALGAALQQLLDAATAKRTELASTLRHFVESGRDAAAEAVRTGHGKRDMDDARRLVQEIHAITDTLAARSSAVADDLLRWGGMLVVGLIAIAFGAGLRGQRIGRGREEEVAARTRAIVETAPLGIAMLDGGLRFLIANGAMGEVAERPAPTLLGQAARVALPPVLGLLQSAMAHPGEVVDATIDGAGPLRDRRSWHGMARADVAKGHAPTVLLLMQDITTRRAAEAERLLLIRELNHRVKNVIATVQGLAGQSWAGAEGDGDVFMEMFGARLRSLAGAHGLLFESGWRHAALTDVMRVALGPWLGQRTGGLVVNGDAGPAPLLAPSQVLGLVLVLHELATNAAKYGALSVPDGRVTLDWERQADGVVQLTWREAGGPPITEPPRREGFGSFLISRAFDSDAVPGQVTRDFAPGGLVAVFRFTPEEATDA